MATAFSGTEKRLLASLYATRYIDLRSMRQSEAIRRPVGMNGASRDRRMTPLCLFTCRSNLGCLRQHCYPAMAQAVDFNQHIFVTSTPTLDGRTLRARFCQVVRLAWGSSSPTDGHLDARHTQLCWRIVPVDFHRLHERPQWIVCNRLGGPASC